MKKLLKASLLLLLPTMCLLAFVACKAPTGPVNYNVSGAANDIPTITSVVGERTFEGSSVTRHAKAEKGNLSVTCVYSGASDPAEDVEAYCKMLVNENGFTQLSSFDSGSGAVLTTRPNNDGQAVRMTITPTNNDGYTIVVESVGTTESVLESVSE